MDVRPTSSKNNPPLLFALGGLGLFGGLVIWARKQQQQQRLDELQQRIVELQAAATAATESKLGTQVGSKCSWQFQPPLYIEKGISASTHMVVDKLDKLTTEFFADGDQIAVKMIPGGGNGTSPLLIHFYSSVLNRFQVTDFQFLNQSSIGYWDLVTRGSTYVTLKLQWLQVFYERVADTLTLIFQFEASVGALVAGETILRQLFEDMGGGITIKSLPGNRFEVAKNNVLGAAKQGATVDELYGLVYYLKYAHMASPELINVLLLRFAKDHPWVERLKKIRDHLKTKCRLVAAESIKYEKPSNS